MSDFISKLDEELNKLTPQPETEDVVPSEAVEGGERREAAPTESAGVEGEAGDGQPARQPVRVPLSELQEERRKRQATEEALRIATERAQANEQTLARLDERIKIANEMRQREIAEQRAKSMPAAPDPEQDPLGHVEWQNQQLRRELEETRQFLQQFTEHDKQRWQQMQQVDAARQLAQHVQASTQNFMRENPDYPQALEFVRQRRDRELQAMGYVDPNQRAQIMQNEVGLVINGALQNNQAPAAVIYRIAKEWGFGGGQPAAADNRMEMRERGVAAATSVSSLPGKRADAAITTRRLAEIPQEEFNRIYRENPEMVNELMRQMSGG